MSNEHLYFDEFTSFGKIPRLESDMTITEKIDGTNAAVVVTDDGRVLAQSRNRFIVVGDDNYGFASWVKANEKELLGLGQGVHFGEWWGQGIQRTYGLTGKRFSLFNVDRWNDDRGDRPECCHVVPTLYVGIFESQTIRNVSAYLSRRGSQAAPGFFDPEGVMVWHHRAQKMFKAPFDGHHKTAPNYPTEMQG
jgi:hypothetical protein